MSMSHAQTSRASHGPSRNRRRREDGGPAWFRPYCRAHHALNASLRLLGSTLRTVATSKRCARRRPVRASRKLGEATALLVDASRKMLRAAVELTETRNCVTRDPEQTTAVSPLLVRADERWDEVTGWLQQAADQVISLHDDLRLGLETGLLVPEQPAERRPRIRLAPRPVPIRAFLVLRQVRVVDRIAPILRRRRRTPRPASVRVPRRNLLGRAPPLFPISVL